jgi:hypothetical protein
LAIDLGMKIFLRWKRDGKRNWALNKARVELDFFKHFLAGCSSRSIRARTP